MTKSADKRKRCYAQERWESGHGVETLRLVCIHRKGHKGDHKFMHDISKKLRLQNEEETPALGPVHLPSVQEKA